MTNWSKTACSSLCWVLVGWGVALTSAWAAGCVHTVRWFDDRPYSYRTDDGSLTGFNVELVREALRRMGCEARWVELPWARALAELAAGKLDILPGALKTVPREQFAYFSRPINRSPNVLFVTKAAAARYPLARLADIVGTDFRLGAQIDVAYGPDYEALRNNPAFQARLVPITVRNSAWSMMHLGRLDGLIADEVTALTELHALGLSNEMVKTRVIVSSDPAHIALSKGALDKTFVAGLDKTLSAMMADGKYKQIRERFVPCSTSVENLGCK